MKCIECTAYYLKPGEVRPDYCNPDLASDKREEECDDFSVLCCICNEGFVEKGECCADLIIPREESKLPCPRLPDPEVCKGCLGFEDPRKDQAGYDEAANRRVERETPK
jgi:hypothetical protein